MKTNNAKWYHFLLALPPMAQFFLVWYVIHMIYVMFILGYKDFVKAMYTQTAIVLFKDETKLNESVESVHRKQTEKSLSFLLKFEFVAMACLISTSVFWFSFPPGHDNNAGTRMIAQGIVAIPDAAISTYNHHFK